VAAAGVPVEGGREEAGGLRHEEEGVAVEGEEGLVPHLVVVDEEEEEEEEEIGAVAGVVVVVAAVAEEGEEALAAAAAAAAAATALLLGLPLHRVWPSPWPRV